MKIYYEGYAEILLASGLSVIAIASRVDAQDWTVWFSTPSDFVNSVLSIMNLLIMLAFPLWLFFASSQLKT